MAKLKLPQLKHGTTHILLEQYDGDKHATLETLEAFYFQFKEDVPKLLSSDAEEVKAIAHKMKTGINLLGLESIEANQEILANESDPKLQAPHIAPMVETLNKVLDELKECFE